MSVAYCISLLYRPLSYLPSPHARYLIFRRNLKESPILESAHPFSHFSPLKPLYSPSEFNPLILDTLSHIFYQYFSLPKGPSKPRMLSAKFGTAVGPVPPRILGRHLRHHPSPMRINDQKITPVQFSSRSHWPSGLLGTLQTQKRLKSWSRF